MGIQDPPHKPVSAGNTDTPPTEDGLKAKLEADPGDWASRKALAHLLYNEARTKEAADLVWEAPEIPPIDLELGFAVKVLGKGRPSRAIRLLAEIQKLNKGKAAQNLGLANALLHHGMVMQAARFYGAAIELDPELVNADQEHFLLWVDDREKLWGKFEEERPKLEELPWIKRDAKQAEQLKRSMKGHTTPISIPGLQRALAEEAAHAMYVQSDHPGDEVSPPPAVTIPMDRVEPRHVVIDNERGAGQPVTAEQARAAAGPVSKSMGAALPGAQAQPPQIPAPAPLSPPPGTPVHPAAQVPAAQEPAPPPPASVVAPQQEAAAPIQPVATVPLARAPGAATPAPPAGAALPTPTVKLRRPTKTQLTEDGRLRIPPREE
jgi:tetratricopeptide (TPR) repeat protein